MQLPTQTAAQPPAAAKRKSDGNGDGPDNGDTPADAAEYAAALDGVGPFEAQRHGEEATVSKVTKKVLGWIEGLDDKT